MTKESEKGLKESINGDNDGSGGGSGGCGSSARGRSKIVTDSSSSEGVVVVVSSSGTSGGSGKENKQQQTMPSSEPSRRVSLGEPVGVGSHFPVIHMHIQRFAHIVYLRYCVLLIFNLSYWCLMMFNCLVCQLPSEHLLPQPPSKSHPTSKEAAEDSSAQQKNGLKRQNSGRQKCRCWCCCCTCSW